MANVKVRLKDASNNVLHPETDWSVVLNKPSIDAVKQNNDVIVERWNASSKGNDVEIDGDVVNIYSRNTSLGLESFEDMFLTSGASIQIKDGNTQQKYVSLANYPINWSALNMNNGPFKEFLDLNSPDFSSHAKTSIQNAVFGIYSVVSSNIIFHYPAFAIVSRVAGGRSNRDAGYYLNSSGNLTKITDMSNFSGFLDY